MVPDFASMMREAKNLKVRLEQIQAELGQLECTGEAGGGLVRCVMNGNFEVRRMQIEPAAVEDAEMLEDLLAAAVNDAVRRIREAIQARFSGLTGGLPFPPGLIPGL